MKSKSRINTILKLISALCLCLAIFATSTAAANDNAANKKVRVMTRNLYLSADIMHIVNTALTNPDPFAVPVWPHLRHRRSERQRRYRTPHVRRLLPRGRPAPPPTAGTLRIILIANTTTAYISPLMPKVPIDTWASTRIVCEQIVMT